MTLDQDFYRCDQLCFLQTAKFDKSIKVLWLTNTEVPIKVNGILMIFNPF